MEKNPWVRALAVIAVIALVIYLVGQVWVLAQHYSDIIIIFFLAWLLAFTLGPLASSVQQVTHSSRAIASTLVYLFLFVNVSLVFVLIVPLAGDQMVQLGQRSPGYLQEAQAWGQSWSDYIEYELGLRGLQLNLAGLPLGGDIANQIGSLGTGVVTNTISVVGGLASAVTGLILVLVLSFYLVLDGASIRRGILGLVPQRYQAESEFFVESMNKTFGGWLRGTLIVSMIYGVGNAVVMGVAGLAYVLLATVLAVFLVIVPLIGPVLAMVMPVALALLSGDLSKVLITVIGLLVLQILVYNVISPKVLGDTVGLHPLLVLLALLVGLKQAGILGAIFGVPVVGVLYAMFIFFVRKAQSSEPVLAVEGVATLPRRDGMMEGDVVAGVPASRPRRLAARLGDMVASARSRLTSRRD